MSKVNENEKSVEAKLGDLMMQGWTMLADACFKESCRTPLMKDNISKQIYCVGCEAWVCNKERKHTNQKFQELVSLEGRRNIQIKNNNEITLPTKKIHIENSASFKGILESKLMAFSHWLEIETDIVKCNQILDAIKKTMDLLNDLSQKVKREGN